MGVCTKEKLSETTEVTRPVVASFEPEMNFSAKHPVRQCVALVHQ